MKTLKLTLLALAAGLIAVTTQAREFHGYWHGHPSSWWMSHHYRWTGGEYVLIPGYDYEAVEPVYEYYPWRHRYYHDHYRYHYRYHYNHYHH